MLPNKKHPWKFKNKIINLLPVDLSFHPTIIHKQWKVQGKIIYNGVRIFLGQHCLCNVGPECTKKFSQENNLYNVVLICMCQHYTRKLPEHVDPYPMNNFAQENNLQCYSDLCGRTLCKRITSIVLAHSWKRAS